jgi:NDP-sugar pyrophosphorylase family protein
VPKALLKVGTKPILQHTIEMVRDQLGIRRIVIVTGHLGHMIQKYFQDGAGLNVAIRYLENRAIDKGLPWSIHLARNHVEDPFLVILGDEFYSCSNHHSRLLTLPLDDHLALCGMIRGGTVEQIRQNYIVEYSEGKVCRLVEKPRRVQGDLMGTGTFVLAKDIFRHIEEDYRNSGTCLDFVALLDRLCRQGHSIGTFLLTGEYVNINDATALRQANSLHLSHCRNP